MGREDTRIVFRVTQKNKSYLERLGYLDRRTGNARKGGPNISQFVNECITNVLEVENHFKREIASNEDLMSAWRKHCVAARNKEIERLTQEIQQIVNWQGEK
jgi:hypothetical protein